jgi:hypothetical protein
MEDKSCMFPFVCPYYLYITSFVYQKKTLGECVLRNAKLWTTDEK